MTTTNRPLHQEIAVTAELTGTSLSEAAAEIMAVELAAYPRDQVLGALRKCRKELKTRLTMAAVIERLDDGRPAPNEAWAALPKSEDDSVVWTDEMSAAYAVCASLIFMDDMVAARMAFLEAYRIRVDQAREHGRPVHWTPSLGHDKGRRDAVIEEANRLGRLGYDQSAHALLTDQRPPANVMDTIPRLAS